MIVTQVNFRSARLIFVGVLSDENITRRKFNRRKFLQTKIFRSTVTRFSREDSQNSLRDTPDLLAEALDSMEQVQHLGECTSDARGKLPEVPAPYLEELTHDLTRTIHDSAGGASHTLGHNLTSEVAGDPSQGASHNLTMDVMDNSRGKVIHGPARGSEPSEFPMPVCGTKIKVQPTTVPQMARSTESGMGKVVITDSIHPGGSPSTVVARGHVLSREQQSAMYISIQKLLYWL